MKYKIRNRFGRIGVSAMALAITFVFVNKALAQEITAMDEMAFAIDNLTMFVSAVLVLFMQAGFAMVEVGFNSGKNTIKEYQLRYHAGRTIGAEDLRLLFGMNFSRTSISQVITGRKKRHLGFFFENYTGAPGQPTPENPKKKIKDTYY